MEPQTQAEQREDVLRFFAYRHLPEPLQPVSRPFCEVAHAIGHGESEEDKARVKALLDHVSTLPDNRERGKARRKVREALASISWGPPVGAPDVIGCLDRLLEAKDAAVRAAGAEQLKALQPPT